MGLSAKQQNNDIMKITIGTKVRPTFQTKNWLGTGTVDEILEDGKVYVLWENGMEGGWEDYLLRIISK
jgi:hypothetical protein